MFKSPSDAPKPPTTIQNIAIKLVSEQMKLMELDNGPKETTVFVLGSKGAGKSGIINKFFDREENSRPTLALEYSFGRRTGQMRAGDKQILNVWELGCLYNSNQLVEVPMRSHGLENFSAMIVLDLSQPNRLWSDLECSLQGLKRAYTKQASESDVIRYRQKAEERISRDHPDAGTLELFPFSIVIVGGKYDVFQDFDPEIKKHVCRCLRSISHAIGAALLFYSQKIPSLAKTMRDTFSHLGFDSPAHPFRNTTTTDYNGPLMIWFGQDSWDKVGVTPSNSERIGVNFNAEIRQVKDDIQSTNVADDPAKDPGFRESLIDEMRAQKDEELMTLIRDTEIRSKFETVAS